MSCLRSRLLALLLAAGLSGCSGAPPAQPAAASAANAAKTQPRRVILIVIDGGSAGTLHELHRQGVLDQGGFERFFRDGEVADALIPVLPSLSSTNHATLATGFPPAATGIVGNRYRGAGARMENGFDALIGTETLWEAARRQGRRVGVPAWPGIDAKGERRKADWGLVLDSQHEPQVVALARADWQPAPPASSPEGVASHSPLLTSRVTIRGAEGTGGTAGQAIDLFAIDSVDDGKVGYDRVAVLGEPYTTGPLSAGEWRRLAWPLPDGRAVSSLKLLALAPDLSRTQLFVDGIHRTVAYPAELAGSVAAKGPAWPGFAFNNGLSADWEGKPGIDLETWAEQSEHLVAFYGEALRLAAARPDWDLLMYSVAAIDQAGHALLLLDSRQPMFSAQRRDDFTRVRNRLWRAFDAELRKLLDELDLARTTVVVVGDHGMLPVHTAIDPSAPLAELGLLASKTAYAVGNGGAAHVYLEPGGDAGDAAERERLLSDITRAYTAWRVDGEAPVEKIFTRKEAAQIGLDHANSGDLIVFVNKGFVARQLPEGKASAPAPLYGVHGHLSTYPEIQALYLALGAGVKPRQGGTLDATDVAPRVAAWLGIDPPSREIRNKSIADVEK